MRTRAPQTGTRNHRPLRRLLAAGVALAALSPATVLAAPAQAEADGASAEPAADVTMIQANIYTKLTVERFQADVAEVLSYEPDFVTYNEVPFRNDAVLAPTGYAIHRSKKDRFTAATPVLWRTDRWSRLDAGTAMVSDWRGKPPGREVELGRRYANWVTLQGVDGRVVSVVSAHVAPKVDGMPDLLRPSVTRIGGLVDRLADRGPVLVGGDFNVHYRSGRYPRDILDAHGLVPTYDTLGTHFPTGDHRGNTIDYVFARGSESLLAGEHRPVELWSDHDAVVAGLSWQADAPTTMRRVANDPDGERADQRAVLHSLVGGIRRAGSGSLVQVATTRLDLAPVVRQLKRAVARGVHVQVVIGDRRPTTAERRVARALAASGDGASWLRRCGARCQDAWKAHRVPRGFMLVTGPDGTGLERYDTNRSLTSALVERVATLDVSTGRTALEEGREMFRALR